MELLPINMFDPKRDYRTHQEEYDQIVGEVMASGYFIGGPHVKALEEELAAYVGVDHAISCANGTDALQISMMALDIGPGDEVITVPHTWISTSEAIAILGAKPVFVDIEDDTFNIDVSKIEEKITENTKAILPVSLYGQMPDYDAINSLAEKYNIAVIEDGAQSFGATLRDRKSCSVTKLAITSFFPSKPLGCYGDGGALFTNDEELALKIRAIKSHGGIKRFHHKYIGMNSRLDAIQAAVLRVKMKYLDEVLVDRDRAAKYYISSLQDVDNIKLPVILPERQHVWAQFPILVESKEVRDHLYEKLRERGIKVAIYYPAPLHYQDCFQYLGYQRGDLPVTERVCDTIINLPCYAEITREEQDLVCKIFRELLSE